MLDELQGPEKELDFCLSRPGNCDWRECVKLVLEVERALGGRTRQNGATGTGTGTGTGISGISHTDGLAFLSISST